jgi:hypothetical protein
MAVHQLAAFQQHMLAQFQQSMLMMAQTFSGMWRDEMELLREILDRLGGLKRQVRGLSAEQTDRKSRRTRHKRPCAEEAAPSSSTTPTSDVVAAAAPTQGASASTDLQPPDASEAANLDPGFHAWLDQRIAALDQDRRGVWQKLLAAILGK